MKSYTLIILKPDALSRKDISEKILSKINSQEDMRKIALMRNTLTLEAARQVYAEHVNKPFYQDLLKIMTTGESLVMVMEGEDIVRRCITMCGEDTDPKLCSPESIRGKWGLRKNVNTIHRSASTQDAHREIGIFFPLLNLKPENE